MKDDSFGDRMKTYESVSQNNLMRRTPVIIRLDGKAFHTFTQGLDKPYDSFLAHAMATTALKLCKQIQGAVFAYTQSDEISILIQDWKELNTESWYGNNVQKMVSVSASIATAHFNDIYRHPYKRSIALFDSRAFNLPEHEVVNYFIWRQNDCVRNSINGLGQSKFSQKQLNGKNTSMVQDMLMETHKINWNDVETRFKRGVCIREEVGEFKCDHESPIFTQDRAYIESTFKFGDSNE